MPAIPASGAIKASELRAQYGITGAVSLSQLYRGGANVHTNDVATIATSGAQKFSNYRGVNHDGGAATDARAGRSMKQIKAAYPTATDGYYYVRASLSSGIGYLYGDMTTDGGGWMLVARTHPTGTPAAGTWGWRGTGTGTVTSFSAPYGLNLIDWYNAGYRFTDYLFGNRNNANDNTWGPFIYKAYGLDPVDFNTVDTQKGAAFTVVKVTPSIYGSSAFPGMQQAIGFPVSGTANNVFYMRDCCGFSTYGVLPNGMSTAYVNAASGMWTYSGPWAMSGQDASGNFTQSSGSTNYGGTAQAMIMIR